MESLPRKQASLYCAFIVKLTGLLVTRRRLYFGRFHFSDSFKSQYMGLLRQLKSPSQSQDLLRKIKEEEVGHFDQMMIVINNDYNNNNNNSNNIDYNGLVS